MKLERKAHDAIPEFRLEEAVGCLREALYGVLDPGRVEELRRKLAAFPEAGRSQGEA